MISRRLVLVLGAGASIPYGFPSGRELVARVIRPDVSGSLLLLGHQKIAVEEFQRALVMSGAVSVDAFLEARPDLADVGKAAMARVLVPCESIGALFQDGQGRWYKYLFDQMKSPRPEGFTSNQVSIVTFNYDRSLEYFLWTALQNRHHLEGDEAARLLQAIPIVHVHGTLGEPHYRDPGGRDYLPSIAPDDIVFAAKGIKIVHEITGATKEFGSARTLIREAIVVCFLGFGYLPQNVKRLDVPSNSESPKGPKLMGSNFGMGDDEIARARLLFPRDVSFGHPSRDCLTFLREEPMLSRVTSPDC